MKFNTVTFDIYMLSHLKRSSLSAPHSIHLSIKLILVIEIDTKSI